MSKTHGRLQELIKLYLQQAVTVEERNELWDYVNDPIFELETKKILAVAFDEVVPVELEESRQQDMLQHIFKESPAQQKPPLIKKLWTSIAVAASVIIVVGMGIYFSMQTKIPLAQLATNNGIKAGGNKAVLTFADGKQIVLSEKQTGIVIATDKITYNDGSAIAGPDHSSNQYTISTPKGGTYQLSLADGTKIWLNAASTFKQSDNRMVSLSGEAYFAVAKDEQRPFIVNGTDQNVKVLGTRFNINNYKDEKEAKTTLLEGSVNVTQTTKGKTVTLKPGQQSVIAPNSFIVKEIDTNDVVAWKGGFFSFNNDDIRTVMAQLAKWYDVELVYVGKPSTEHFTGQISRSKNIGLVLEYIEKTKNIKFEIEGKTVKVIQ